MSCGPRECDDGDHPAAPVLGLEGLEGGCRWLLGRWKELEAVIDSRSAWASPRTVQSLDGCGVG